MLIEIVLLRHCRLSGNRGISTYLPALILTVPVGHYVIAGNIRKTEKHNLLGSNVWTLLHQTTNCEPQRVQQTELILQYIRFIITRMRIVPFIGTESASKNRQVMQQRRWHTPFIVSISDLYWLSKSNQNNLNTY